MGIYSEKILEESRKNKIKLSHDNLNDVDMQIEALLTRLKQDNPNNLDIIRDTSSAIMYKISIDFENFVDKTGKINVESLSKSVNGIVEQKRQEESVRKEEEKRQENDRQEKSANKEQKDNEKMSSIKNIETIEQEYFKGFDEAIENAWKKMTDKKKENVVKELTQNLEVTPEKLYFLDIEEIKNKMIKGEATLDEIEKYIDELKQRKKGGNIEKEDEDFLENIEGFDKDNVSVEKYTMALLDSDPKIRRKLIFQKMKDCKSQEQFFEAIKGTDLEDYVELIFEEAFKEGEYVKYESEDIKYAYLAKMANVQSIIDLRKQVENIKTVEQLQEFLDKTGWELPKEDTVESFFEKINNGTYSEEVFDSWINNEEEKYQKIKKDKHLDVKDFTANETYVLLQDNQTLKYMDETAAFYKEHGSLSENETSNIRLENKAILEQHEEFVFSMNDYASKYLSFEKELGIAFLQEWDNNYQIEEKNKKIISYFNKNIAGTTTLEKIMAKPKEMVLDYLEMEIKSGADPQNTALVMADMLRDKKLLTKFKGASETGLSIEEYAEIMSGVVMETQKMIDEGKLPETITENGVDRQTSIDDFINMTFDDTEILLSNLPERISGLSREEIAQLIAEKVKESTREQEFEMAEYAAILEEVENEVRNSEKLNIQENSSQEQETINQAEQDELAARLQKEQVAEEQAQQEAPQQEPEVQEEVAPKETALVADKDRTLMQKASAGIRNFFKEAKEKVGDFFESIKEKFGRKSDDKFGSEVFAMDATKKNNEPKKKDEDQWQTIDGNESLKAAQEEAKRKAEEEKEKKPVSVGERDEK